MVFTYANKLGLGRLKMLSDNGILEITILLYCLSVSCCTNLSLIHTYISVSNAILFFLYSSLLCVSAATSHHLATVYLAKTDFSTVLNMNAWTAFACSNSGVMGSNPTQGMGVCVHLICLCGVLFAGSSLTTGWPPPPPPSPRSPANCIGLRNWKSGHSPKGSRAIGGWGEFKMNYFQIKIWTVYINLQYNQDFKS
jgi:hypothetical protein